MHSKSLVVIYGERESIKNIIHDIDAFLPSRGLYVMGIVPFLRSRVFFNRLYIEVVTKKLMEEFKEVDEILGKKGVDVVNKEIVHGKPGDVLRKYIRDNGFETVFIPLQLPPSTSILRSVADLVSRGALTAILYTPQTRIGCSNDILVLARENPPCRFHVGYTGIADIDTVEIAFTHKPSLDMVEDYLRKRKGFKYKHLVLSMIRSRDVEERIKDGLRRYRFVIIHPELFYKKAFRGYMITPLAKAVLLSSRRPVIVSA